MPSPPAYDRLYDLTEYAAAHTAAPYNAAMVDAELDAIEQSIDGLVSNQALIQKSDGGVRNGVVGLDALSSAVLALITASGGVIKGAWLTATAYVAKDVVSNGTGTYICAVAHTSGTFATDLAAAKWVQLYNSSGLAASGITFTPTGSVAAGDVQAAIAEVDSEKLAKSDNLASVASRATAFANLVAPGGTMTGALSFSGARINEAQGADIASSATINLDTATGNLVDVTGTTTITGITLSQGRHAVVRFTGVLTLTHSGTLVLPSAANIITAAGDFAVFRGYAAGVVRCTSYTRADGQPLIAATLPRGLLHGLTMSTAGASTTLTVASGAAVDGGNTVFMTLAASISKTTASWAVGTAAGGLDTGVIANDTTYHWYLIRRPDTGVVDVVFSTNASTPTLPSGYTQFRRIGSWLTNASGQWRTIVQDGDMFRYATPIQDVSSTSLGTSAVTQALASLPLGVRVNALLNVGINTTAGGSEAAYLSDLSLADLAPSSTAAPGMSVKSHVTNAYGYADMAVMTNTSRQIRVRMQTGGATEIIKINTLGWIDRRGRDA